jgi:hypothetical protein
VLLEHHPGPESGEGMETLDLVRIGAAVCVAVIATAMASRDVTA